MPSERCCQRKTKQLSFEIGQIKSEYNLPSRGTKNPTNRDCLPPTLAFEHHGLKPDIVTLGKGMGGGVPISAVLARGEVAHAFEIGDHGSTLSGNQLACAAATVVIDCLKGGLLAEVAEKGDYLKGRLSYFTKYNFVMGIYGLGLLQGLQLAPNVNGNFVASMMLQRGILVNCTKRNFLRFLPPYTITREQIDMLCDSLGEIFADTNV